MLKLPQVTLYAMDCVTPYKTLEALEWSVRWVRFAEVLMVSNLKKFILPPVIGYKVPVRYIHREQSDRKLIRKEAPWAKPLPIDYELDMMRLPAEQVQTPFYLAHEADAGVIDHTAWTDEFLETDMVGAPWMAHDEPGYGECDGETNAVGNTGFSLQSMKYARAVRHMTEVFKDDPRLPCHDIYPCRVQRKWLEQEHGIKFAPVELAWRFSCENRIATGQVFGFHGRTTVELNGWGSKFMNRFKETKS